MEIQVNEENSIFPKGVPNNPSYFTGEAYLYPIVDRDQTDGYYSAGSVTFMPGARTYWHTHPSVQVLVATEGRGLVIRNNIDHKDAVHVGFRSRNLNNRFSS